MKNINQSLMSDSFEFWRTAVGYSPTHMGLHEQFFEFMRSVDAAMWDAAADVTHPWARIETAWDRFDEGAARHLTDMYSVRKVVAESVLLGDPRVELTGSVLTVSASLSHANGTALIPIARYNLREKQRWVFLEWFESLLITP